MIQTEFENYQKYTDEHDHYHSLDCENAHDSRCRCSCKGAYHGAKSGFLAKIEGEYINRSLGDDERIMSLDDGGEIMKQIELFSGRKFQCIGVCNKLIAASPIIGYPDHDSGYTDKDGRKWWLFITCAFCGYSTALWKIHKREQEVTISP